MQEAETRLDCFLSQMIMTQHGFKSEHGRETLLPMDSKVNMFERTFNLYLVKKPLHQQKSVRVAFSQNGEWNEENCVGIRLFITIDEQDTLDLMICGDKRLKKVRKNILSCLRVSDGKYFRIPKREWHSYRLTEKMNLKTDVLVFKMRIDPLYPFLQLRK